MKKRSLLCLSLGVLLTVGLVIGASLQALAAPITYMEQTIGTGTLDGTSFSGQLVTITLSGNTSNVTGGSGFFTNNVGIAIVSVAGLGSDTLPGAYVFVNQGYAPPAVGFGSSSGSILDTLHNAFGAYDLTTAIGPQTGDAFYRPDLSYTTGSAGIFHLDSVGNTTFTASAVPLPGALLLFGPGLVGIAAIRRRLRK